MSRKKTNSNDTDPLPKERKQNSSKKELTQFTNSLIDNTNFANCIFEDAGIGMAIIDKNFQIVKYNKAFFDLFGYNSKEMEKMTYLDFIPEEKKERALHFFEALFSSKLEKYQSEQPYCKKDKSLIWLKLNTSVIKNNEGEPEYILGMGEDITESVNYAKELEEAKVKAVESDLLKTAFLTNMSHEIRTPMNAIIGFSELISDPKTDKETQKEFTDQIYNSSIMLLKLIDDIIDISQLDSGNLKINKKKFNISTLLNDLQTKFEKEKEKEVKQNIELLPHNPFGDSIVYFESDSYRFFQIFSNLLSNALKYTESGFIEYGFDINQQEEPIFYVRDTGIGIPEDKTETIFNHFTKIEDKKILYRGTGIGLTITKKLVELLGGNIWLESNLGIGSIFYFTIPGKVILHEARGYLDQKNINYNWSGKKILVAEDDDTNFAIINSSLAQTNAEIQRVLTGDRAIKKCSDENFDLVLMDLRMPVLGGIEATEEIRKFNKTLPIIAQTAYNQNNEKEMSIKAGCNDYIAKPAASYDLLEILNKYISNAK